MMPSMSFSEIIKILENFLSLLDFAVSLALHFYSAVLFPAIGQVNMNSIPESQHYIIVPVCVARLCAEVWCHWTGFWPHSYAVGLIRQVDGLISQEWPHSTGCWAPLARSGHLRQVAGPH